MSGWVFVLLR